MVTPTGVTKVVDGSGDVIEVPVYDPIDVENEAIARVALPDGSVGAFNTVPPGEADTPLRLVDGGGDIHGVKQKPTYIIDDFEGNLNDYSTTFMGGSNGSVSLSNSYKLEGSQSLKITALASQLLCYSEYGWGLNYYPVRGDKFKFWWFYPSQYGDYGMASMYFGLQDTSNWYRIMCALDNDWGTPQFRLVKSVGGTLSTLGGSSGDWFDNNRAYQIEIEWGPGDEITCRVYRSGSFITSFTVNDATYDDGGVGFEHFSGNVYNYCDMYFDYARTV